ncbi:MAG: F0F1 ATP synthase subunit B [Oscillospiraceae bacterium]|nr:F0F1 ATP synthase subunit B [Oscillospiraceae bacterium]
MENINFEFLSIDPVTIIGVLCNTMILFLVFKFVLFKRVKAVVEKRREEISKTYKEADAALESAKMKEDEYTEKLSSAKEESAEIVKNATVRATQRSDEIIAAAKTEAMNITAKANADIEAEKKRAVNQIKDEISGIAVSIAETVVSRQIDNDADQDRLIDEFIAGIGDAT